MTTNGYISVARGGFNSIRRLRGPRFTTVITLPVCRGSSNFFKAITHEVKSFLIIQDPCPRCPQVTRRS